MKRPIELEKINKVAVFGMGKSGVAAVKVLQAIGIETHAINDGEIESWKTKDGLDRVLEPCYMHPQNQASEIFAKMDLIVISPGIATTHSVLDLAHAKKVPLISEIELAYWFCRETPIIAITGTNGKTTTTTMIYEALKLCGKKVFCGGNIGTPYCEMALSNEKYDYAVIEVSSFQLETIREFHPKIALILNLTLNHSERYDGIKDYGLAKFRLLMNMTDQDQLIIGEESDFLVEETAKLSIPRILFSKNKLDADFLKRFDFSKGVLVGEHNRANYYCAWKTLSLLGIINLDQIFQGFINTFPGVEHRLEFVGEFSGLKVYNDAKSTNAEATKTALSAFEKKEELYLVMGGKLRSESDSFLKDLLPFKNKVTKIFTIGMTAQRLASELGQDFKVEVVGDIEKLFHVAKESKIKGSLVFSPAHPSFDQFKNYVDRGVQFKEKARKILS
ncbi:MAG: UDP-N-acetylmuramoyl-L-alanine--D-glutamate ligase [Bacteriovoracaceae bacterium]|nr:UDP-N-acetylmuramoyl-L-alanine--D-glutamate ligase [Bacteriovoracaceae bacterium]